MLVSMVTSASSPEDTPTPGLRPASDSVALPRYLSELWARRDYIRYVAVSQLRSQQMHTVLGNLWHLLNPALQIAVFYLIFGVILGVDRGVDNLLAFIAVGLFSYQFSTRSITTGSNSIVSNRPLLRSVWFPRAMLPITTVLTQLFAFVPVLFVMFAVVIGTGESPLLRWLAIPGVIALQTMFNLGAALIMARAATHLVDIQQLLPFVFRLLLYASGVIFLVDAYVEASEYQLLFEVNPFYGLVSIWRWTVLGFDIDPIVPVATTTISVVALIAGFWWFRRGEQGYTDGQ